VLWFLLVFGLGLFWVDEGLCGGVVSISASLSLSVSSGSTMGCWECMSETKLRCWWKL